MTTSKLLPRLALAALCALSVPAFAAQTDTKEESVTLDRPGNGMHEIKEGDKVPDSYKRKELAIDPAKHGLAQPEENEQWVEIKDKYVRVNIPNGTIVEMIDKSSVKK
ncbi:hypothetical protein AHFPHNDE_02090 [Pseudomonas sp. MM227]|uniref:RcnB family protein n=1 Tax=Pseudomonas baltica TaxID=2762576 RepID=A0A7X1G2Z4_9PSED|nr:MULTISPECIES: RcnB family protein [Pseudomonas]MBC2677261.1 RcnB family protein [Pseudomonas baltica]MBD8730013.1 RcnB family protein [Pseudomonas sp. CFBP 13710]CAI3788414.1 hypothetical protein AHFPHNDE_02090 [Pseudomonas sp. MM227]